MGGGRVWGGAPLLPQFLPLKNGTGTQGPPPAPPGSPALWPASCRWGTEARDGDAPSRVTAPQGIQERGAAESAGVGLGRAGEGRAECPVTGGSRKPGEPGRAA